MAQFDQDQLGYFCNINTNKYTSCLNYSYINIQNLKVLKF